MFRALALRQRETNFFLSDEGPTLETSDDFTIRIGRSIPTFFYFDLYLNTNCLRNTLRLSELTNKTGNKQISQI